MSVEATQLESRSPFLSFPVWVVSTLQDVSWKRKGWSDLLEKTREKRVRTTSVRLEIVQLQPSDLNNTFLCFSCQVAAAAKDSLYINVRNRYYSNAANKKRNGTCWLAIWAAQASSRVIHSLRRVTHQWLKRVKSLKSCSEFSTILRPWQYLIKTLTFKQIFSLKYVNSVLKRQVRPNMSLRLSW